MPLRICFSLPVVERLTLLQYGRLALPIYGIPTPYVHQSQLLVSSRQNGKLCVRAIL